jgi:hypothetical protein
MNALYRLQVMQGEAMSHLMALLEATKITLDNREELVVDLSTEMVEKDLQVEQFVGTRVPGQVDSNGGLSEMGTRFSGGSNCSVFLAPQGHCTGVFIGA